MLRSLVAAYAALAAAVVFGANPQTQRFYAQDPSLKTEGRYLTLELLTDELVHFEYGVDPAGAKKGASGPVSTSPIATSVMVAETRFPGASEVTPLENGYETSALRIEINRQNLCLTVRERATGVELTTVCGDQLSDWKKALTLNPAGTKNLYGLGVYFGGTQSADGDWIDRVWEPGPDGNVRRGLGKYDPSFTQIPVLFALGEGHHNYGLFLDQPYKTRWDFTQNWWRVDMVGPEIRGYVIGGPDLPHLRRTYMSLTGKPMLPPKKIFGLWVSEFGYGSWGEIDRLLDGMKRNGFPVDGFALDLQWYGGCFSEPKNVDPAVCDPHKSRMGSLAWDRRDAHFPSPEAKIKSYKADGVDLMLIEQSYVGENLDEHHELQSRGFLARDCKTCGATRLSANPWWGYGGMIDWSNPSARQYWHDTKREALVLDGIHGHWTDLGEPEMYNPGAWYFGFDGVNEDTRHKHASVHNVYNFAWLKGIQEGYERMYAGYPGFLKSHGLTYVSPENPEILKPGHEAEYEALQRESRYYLLSRSGAAGIQRLGAGMWSGDIGSNLPSLIGHLNTRMHLSLSGVDYFSSDIGGFFRERLDGDVDELYSQWMAVSSLLDVPVRPHTWNLSKQLFTAPDRVGWLRSNLANLRQRYELTPYYYSLAAIAARTGDPVVPPPVYYYQDDPNLREVGNEAMIGRDLLAAVVASYGEMARNVYLPRGKWIDFHSLRWLDSQGETIYDVPAYRHGDVRLPLYARAGALIPKMRVTAQTRNALGLQADGSYRDDLVVRAFASETPSRFPLYEDDGVTIAYRAGQSRTTWLSQKLEGDSATVTVAAAKGRYDVAERRDTWIELVVDGKIARKGGVTLNGNALDEVESQDAFEHCAGGCYFNARQNLILARSGTKRVGETKTFRFLLEKATPATTGMLFVCHGDDRPGTALYVSGNLPGLGNFDPLRAVRLVPHPKNTWNLYVENLPADTAFAWKCLRRADHPSGEPQWEEGNNHEAKTPPYEANYYGRAEGRL